VSSEPAAATGDSAAEVGLSPRLPEREIPSGAACANCAAPLLGAWCYRCGQAGEDFHRSTWRLIVEAAEGLFHLDGRMWTTLPDLLFRPGRLTRAYLDGHRAPQIPPLRLFLVVLLVVFLAGWIGAPSNSATGAGTGSHGRAHPINTHNPDQLTAAERAQAKKEIAKYGVDPFNQHNTALNAWVTPRVERVFDDPERFELLQDQWAERFALLALPLAAGLLSLLFIFQRRFYVFDHTIFSLHSLSAVGLMLALAMLFSSVTGGLSNLVLLAAPAHLFAHMRGVYGTRVAGTLLRMALLFIGSAVGAAVILAGLFFVGLNGMGVG
jgi:hypothetical protein